MTPAYKFSPDDIDLLIEIMMTTAFIILPGDGFDLMRLVIQFGTLQQLHQMRGIINRLNEKPEPNKRQAYIGCNASCSKACFIDRSDDISGPTYDFLSQANAREWVELVIHHSSDEEFPTKLEEILACIKDQSELANYAWGGLKLLANLAGRDKTVDRVNMLLARIVK